MVIPKKVDILGDLLTCTDEGAFPGLTELSGFIARQEKPSLQETSPEENNGQREAGKKKKVTYYLSPEISEELDRILPQIRKLIPGKRRKRISKSRLVDSALRLVLREYQENGKKSLLVRHFLPNDRDGN